MTYSLAIDIGASSGRHIIGCLEEGRVILKEVYRFPNGMVEKNGRLCWDTAALFDHIIKGMRACREEGFIPDTLGIDTWGVDYVLLDQHGQLIGDAVAYRDERTQGMDLLFEQRMSDAARYARTGIAKQPYNTLYQLMAEFKEQPEKRQQAHTLLFMPCYLSYLLTGVKQNEYTIASTSSLMNCRSNDWDDEVLAAVGIPRGILGDKPVPSGTALGQLLPQVQEAVGFDCQVVLPACHDTASAYLAMPVDSPHTARLSSGTWSLLGLEMSEGIVTEQARLAGFTNEGGYGGGKRFLRNITGMWILQSLKKEWQDALSHAEMTELAEVGKGYQPVFDPADDRFLSPDSMEAAILAALADKGAPAPPDRAALLYCVHHSLALCYRNAINRMQEVTGVPIKGLNIVGGGSQNTLLNQLTANAAKLPVTAGPVECSALGNVLAQLMIAQPDLQPANIVKSSFPLAQFLPEGTGE